MIDWTSLSPKEFEQFCEELLRLNEFQNLEWHGKGGSDRGRDLVATKNNIPLPGISKTQKWIVQCRRYIKKKISKGEISEMLAAAEEHDPDVFLLVLTATMTSGVQDWWNSVASKYRFDMFRWDERALEDEIRRHGSKLKTRPKFVPGDEPTYEFYQVVPVGAVYRINLLDSEFEEVGFSLLNSDGPREDREILRRFVEFIRENDIEFPEDDDEDDEAD